MRSWVRASVAGLVALACLPGCSQSRCHLRGGHGRAAAFEWTLPEVEPGVLEFDLARVGTPGEVDALVNGRPGEYRSLGPAEAQCMAAAASTQGNSLAAEQRAIRATAGHWALSEEDELKLRVLRASELEARNNSAGAALEIYFRLAEAEANLAVLDESLAVLDEALKNIDRLREEGVQVPFDTAELVSQRTELMQKRVELEWTLGQLNGGLIPLLGLETSDPYARIWPVADWTVVVQPIEMEAAVAEGLALRPEMRLLAYLGGSLNSDTLSVVRQVLSGGTGLLGAQPKFTGLISLFAFWQLMGKHANERELPVRRRQLAQYIDQREQEIANEIRQAVLTVEARLRQVAWAKEAVEFRERRIVEVEQAQTTGGATFADVATARLRALEAQSDAISRVIAWKVAEVELRESQGLLVEECRGCF